MRIARTLKFVLLGVAALIGLLGFVAYVLLETRWGLERVRQLALGLVNDRIPGTVTVARIDGPSLLGGLRMYGITVADPDGQPVLSADSARVSYDWRSFLRRRPVLDDVFVFGLDVRVAREPGEERFGIQRAFTSDQPADTVESGPGTPFEVHDVQIYDGDLLVRQPIDGEPAASERFVVEVVPGGRVRTFEFHDISARLGSAVIGGPDARVAIQLEAATLQGRVLRAPFILTDARGRITLRDSTLLVDMPEMRLPDSHVSVGGTITLGEAGTGLDLEGRAHDVALTDVRWVDAQVPDRGRVSGAFKLVTRDGTYDVDGEDMRLTIDGSLVTGSGGVIVGEPLRFTDVDLLLEPLELALLDEYIDRELPIEGLVEGRITANGTFASLATDGNVRVRPRGTSSPARVQWSGVAGLSGDPVLRDVDVQVQGLDATVLAQFSDAVRLSGTLDASLVASGPLARGVRIDGTITHTLPAGGVSTLSARGSVGYASGATSLDLELGLQPLQLAVLAGFSPRLDQLRGVAAGNLTVRGPLDGLSIAGSLDTPAGGLSADMRITGTQARSFAGEVTLARFRPAELFTQLPDMSATGRLGFDLTGTDLATLSGPLTVMFDSATFQRARVGPIRADARFAEGTVTIDTLVADGPGTVLRANGGLGLVAGRSDTLAVSLTVSSLQPLEPYVFAEESEDPTVPRIDGRATAELQLSGSIQSLTLDAAVDVPYLRWQEERAHGLRLIARGSGLNADTTALDVQARADSIAVFGHRADSTRIAATLSGGVLSVDGRVGAEDRNLASFEAVVRRVAGAIETRIVALAFGDDERAWSLAQPAFVRIDGPTITVDSLALMEADGPGRFTASGQVSTVPEDTVVDRLPLDFQATVAELPLGELLGFAGFEVDAQGSIGANLRLTGTPRAPQIDGDIAILDFALDDAVLDSLGARIDYANQRMEVQAQAFRGGQRVFHGEGRVPVDLTLGSTGTERRLAEELDFSFQADSMPARFLLGFVDAFSDVEGLLDGQVSARGTAREPELRGAFTLRRGAATLPEIGVRYRNVIGIFQFERGTAVSVDVTAAAAPAANPGTQIGGFRVTGELDIDPLTNPGFDLEILAQNALAARRRDVDLIASGQLELGGRYEAPILSGDLRVEEATFNIDELYRQYLVVGLEDPLLFDVVDTSLVSVKRVLPESENPFLKNLRVEDFDVTVGQGSWLRSREMNVEVTGDINVLFDRTTEDLVLTGTLNTVRGTYRLEYPLVSRVFDVREGTVEFPGTPGVNPNLNVTAVYRVRRREGDPLDILAVVTGTLENPRVNLRSDEDVAISESDLASYLFFGVPSYAIGSGAPGGGGTFGEFDDLVTATGFGYLSTSLQSLAQSVGLFDYVGVSAAEGTQGLPGQQSGLIQNTQIELGRYITPEVFVIWTQRLGSRSTSPDIRLEWQLTQNYTALFFAEDRFARTPSFGLSQITNARKVLGFLLYREWGY